MLSRCLVAPNSYPSDYVTISKDEVKQLSNDSPAPRLFSYQPYQADDTSTSEFAKGSGNIEDELDSDDEGPSRKKKSVRWRDQTREAPLKSDSQIELPSLPLERTCRRNVRRKGRGLGLVRQDVCHPLLTIREA